MPKRTKKQPLIEKTEVHDARPPRRITIDDKVRRHGPRTFRPLYDLSPDLPPIDPDVWEHLYVCGICGDICGGNHRLMRHIKFYHDMSYPRYVVLVKYGGTWPTCIDCGTQRASKGMSIYSDVDRPRCKACHRVRYGEPGVVQKAATYVDQLQRRRGVVRPKERVERICARIDVVRSLLDEGSHESVDLRKYLVFLEEHIEAVKRSEAKKAQHAVHQRALEDEFERRRRRRRKKKVDGTDDGSGLASHVALGFRSERELWKRIDEETKAAKKGKKR